MHKPVRPTGRMINDGFPVTEPWATILSIGAALGFMCLVFVYVMLLCS